MNILQSISRPIQRNLFESDFRQMLQPQGLLFSAINTQTLSETSLTAWNWTKQAGLGLIGALALFMLGGAVYQELSTRIDAKNNPPMGELIDIGGYKMHLYTTGSGGPAVVLDPGLGCNALGWQLVQPEIAKFTKVVSFDRPGHGWSDESPLERTSQNIVTELHTALHKANIPGPYILVGHSFGGLNARLFASLYPNEVLGVVLVDSAHENMVEKIPMPQINHTLMMLASRLGIIRLCTHLPTYRKSVAVFPEQVQSQLLSQQRTTKFMRTVLQESSHIKTSCNQLKATGGHLGDKPLTIITAVKQISEKGSGMTREQIDAVYIPFQALQKDLLTKSSRSKQVFAEESDHMITHNQPQIIVEAVKEMIEVLDA